MQWKSVRYPTIWIHSSAEEEYDRFIALQLSFLHRISESLINFCIYLFMQHLYVELT